MGDLITDADHRWALDQMDLWKGAIDEAADTADALIANWADGRNVSRFWPGKTLAEAVQERYPDIGLRRAQQVIAAGVTRAALPAETEGMSDRAIDAAGRTTTHGGDRKSSQHADLTPDPDKTERVRETLAAAREASGGKPPTAQQVREAKHFGAAPSWKGQFTRWCRKALPEQKKWLIEMRTEIDSALDIIGRTD